MACDGNVPSGAPINDMAGTHTFTVRAVDREGRTATQTVAYEVLDLKPPHVELRNPPLNTVSVYDVGTTVLADYSCSDPDSPEISCTGDVPSGSPIDTSRVGYGTLTVRAVDPVGHSYHAQSAWYVLGPPIVGVSTPADGDSYLLASTHLTDYGCASGIQLIAITACEGTLPNGAAIDTSTSALGSHTFTVTGVNEHGLTRTVTHRYSVVYDFSGFDNPVDSTGSMPDAKAGEPVPLKFSLSGDRGSAVVANVAWQLASCADWTSTTAVAASGQLSYSASSGRYTDAVSSSKSWKGSCRILVLRLADGTEHAVKVSFTH